MSPNDSFPIAMIPYINMAPYRQMGAPPHCHFVPLVPKLSIAALQSRRVLAAAVPVGGLFTLKDTVEVLGEFGIAAKKESMSVMFFSDRPFEAMDDQCTIRLTSDSASSVRLLYLLWYGLGKKNHMPRLTACDQTVNGELLIGDKALKRAELIQRRGEKAAENLPIITDLASLWRQWYDLPFVFARWVVRKDADEKVKSILIRWLQTFRRKEAEMVAACITPAASMLKIDNTTAKRYFQVIHRCLDHRDLLGQERFVTEFQKVRKEPLFSTAIEEDGA